MSRPSKIVIASRESRLAMWQAVHVRERLSSLNPGSEVVILGMTTKGDQILDRPLAEIGGKGLFIKELEVAMQEGQADLAVHSLKDVPMDMPAGFLLAAITARENPCDAFVSTAYESLDALPPGAVVGTSSLRREAILRSRYPHLSIEPLRGNLDTRLRKLDDGKYDAIILAAAGLLQRLPTCRGQGLLLGLVPGVQLDSVHAQADRVFLVLPLRFGSCLPFGRSLERAKPRLQLRLGKVAG